MPGFPSNSTIDGQREMLWEVEETLPPGNHEIITQNHQGQGSACLQMQ